MIAPEVGSRDIIARWPDDAREAAQAIIQAYGEPDEYTPSMLIWYNNGPWKKTIVYRNAARHDFPFPHADHVEQFIDHEAPMEKACEIMAFNGSVAMFGTKGELSSCCRDEPANFLSLNLARDIIQGKKTFHQARSFFAKSMLQHRQNKPVPYMEKLQFGPQENTIDPDESVIKEKSGRSGNGRQK